MTARRSIALVAILMATTSPLAAFADAAPATPAPKVAVHTDADEVVCKVQDTAGTRLGAKKVCLTRSQWAEIAQQARQNVEHSQTIQTPK